ncbi:phosphoenolpyruvate carboxykinase (ATP) [Paenibacillus rigui]|uniref:Phosphoenolpyruvate carboxykinase (ATP) n=1 Tax=Paenibacillus rigui TaxID=554312 RepID=A0A229UTY6_9BACL|nr:phosphoenolpyruvate carboxykinase (ATP) [Paenibacillus rigui]OXM86976.1 phosphoenolpyruvate carboxykinase (ATP) [Paenibacillus rigui]
MQNTSHGLDLGAIVCKHCEELIDTFDAEKVTTYYSDCQSNECRKGRSRVKQHRNLSVSELIQKALERNEGTLASTGALRALTGKYTGRSPKDKYIVQEPSVWSAVDWGSVNQPISRENFDRLYEKALRYMEDKELYIFDGFAGADPLNRLPIRVINEYAWHNLFARQLFIRPTDEELNTHRPAFTVIALPGFKADPAADGTRSDTFIGISFEKKVVLIAGTEYAGEMKKSIFSVLNYLLPSKGIMPMHCSANVGEAGDVALFFGLSGTGKTTLSADSNRRLIGDDEHGWTDQGVFNFEGGCYAKCANLSEKNEPQIWRAIGQGTVLENVALDPTTGVADYYDTQLTENTRAAYPMEAIANAVIPGIAGHPKVIIFLTADAFGVLPPIAKLTKEQAMYHFLSGYTSKLAGTERGVTQPEATFSSCFGAPFLPLHPSVYANMLGRKIEQHQVRVYLVNTGWTGGAYGVGKRMDLAHTRRMVTAALDGSIEQASFTADPIFDLLCPDTVPGVPSEVLQPMNTWSCKDSYEKAARQLLELFKENYKKHTVLQD